MKFPLQILSVLCLATSVSFANKGIEYEKVTLHSIARTASHAHQWVKHAKLKDKKVTVVQVKLTDAVSHVLQKNIFHAKASLMRTMPLPKAVHLGMRGVPVLDQGQHGTCATFALFAALDALSGQGEYYSELCSLNLGNYLQKHGYSYSGWNGHDIDMLLARIDEYGLVSKEQQRQVGCAGMTEYPTLEDDPDNAMSIEDFHRLSEGADTSGLAAWTTFFDITQWYTKDKPMQTILDRTKRSLYHGNRIVVGALLPLSNSHIGLVAHYHTHHDTWALTPELEQSIKLSLLESAWGGHAMVITGYDDDAVAIDEEGHAHQGLFTLRNSWGGDVGDQGDFYMSYDYFNVLVMQLTELIRLTNVN